MTQEWTQEERGNAYLQAAHMAHDKHPTQPTMWEQYRETAIDLACERNLLREALKDLMWRFDDGDEPERDTDILQARAALDRCGK